ncbi:hypothetical protein GGI16_005252, partial [Coemansia sp. S142-1]
MVQAATQGPVTPSRQLGVARGPKRTPSSRTKKPYARPAPAAQGSSSSSTTADYQTEAAPGFLRGMRSLVARLWGTSLKPLSDAAAPAPDSALASHKCTAEANAGMRSVAESTRPTAMQPTATAADISEEATPTIARHASAVSEYTRSRRPTAESLFAPSPFAYNKRLATATPSVAHLRDVERVKDQSPALSRRHSVGRIDPRRPRLSAGVPLSGSQSGPTDSDDPTQYMSPSSARRLLSTLNSISTPILDARGRATPRLSATVGVTSGYQHSANIGERASAVPLRRLPVSLLALSDTPNKIHRSPLGDPANVLDKATLRRSSSLRGTLRSQNTVPSLARTIQMKQARKAVAERLLQCQSAESNYAESDASSHSATQSPLSAAPECFDDVAVAGSVHPREEDDVEQTASKRRRATGGEAVRLSGDVELDGIAARASNGHVGRSRQALGRRLGRAGRSLSTVDSGVKWRFSARLAPTSDDEADSGPESDEDREALTAKVPLSKIRGGELLGLSQHVTSSTQSTSSSVGYSAVRSTGFGSTRMPIPLFSEPETKEAAPTAVSVSTSASTTTAFSATAATTAPFLTSTAATAPTIVPVTDRATEEAAPVAKTAAPASSSLFSGISFKPALEATGASKSEPEKATGAAAPAVGSTPLFSFGKPALAETADKPAEIPDNTSEVATAPTTPVFSFTKTSAADSTPSTKTIADTWGKSTALPGALGVKPSTSNTTGATTPELAPKPVTSAPTFSFGLSKPAAATSTADSSKPAAAPSLFSFGSVGSSAPAATTTVTTEEKPKSDVKFNFGSFGAATSSETPNILATKRSRGDEATESAGAAPKPAFSFTSGATSGGGSGGFTLALSTSTSNAPVFGSLASKDTSPAATSGFKPSSTFSFGGAAPSTSSAPFSFGLGSKPVPEPEKIIDTTMDSSDSMATTSAPSNNIFGSGTTSAPLTFGASSSKAPATSTFNFASSFGGSNAEKPAAGPSTTAFGGFGKSAATGSSAAEPAAKKPAFSFGAALGTPRASTFESTSVATPSATSFTNPAAAAPTPAFGAAAATPSVFGFGSAASSAVTPATTGFTFGAKPALQQSNTFGSISSQLGSSGFGNTSTTQTSSGNAFGSMITSQPISNGFGSTQPSQTTSNVFGNAQPSQAASSAFGSSNGGLGFGSNPGQRNVSSGSFTFGNPSSSSTGFGGSFTGTGGFGQQQQQQPQQGSSAMPSFSSQPGGFGPSAGNSAFGGASNTSAFG